MFAPCLPDQSPAASLARTNWLDISDSPSLLYRLTNASNPILAEICEIGPEIRREAQRSPVAVATQSFARCANRGKRFP